MNRRTLKALERHAQAAADILCDNVVSYAADTLLDPDPHAARDALDVLAQAALLRQIANTARVVRKEVV